MWLHGVCLSGSRFLPLARFGFYLVCVGVCDMGVLSRNVMSAPKCETVSREKAARGLLEGCQNAAANRWGTRQIL